MVFHLIVRDMFRVSARRLIVQGHSEPTVNSQHGKNETISTSATEDRCKVLVILQVVFNRFQYVSFTNI